MPNSPTEPLLGLYLPCDPFSAAQTASGYGRRLGGPIRILSFYFSWGGENNRLDLAAMEEVIRRGFIPMITWEPWKPVGPTSAAAPHRQPDFSLTSLFSLRYEEYIRGWASSLRKLPGPILFRPMHEMNGNWYPWCGMVNGNQPQEFIETWCYLRAIFRKAGADSLQWVWSPYVHSAPDEPGNEMERYFPGASEVDWLGLDGYNWGTTREWSRWQSFGKIFESAYRRITRLAPDKPVIIAEMGCAEEGGRKADWIEDGFRTIGESCPDIRAIVWFNIDKECDWRIESSEDSMASFSKNWKRFSLKRWDQKGSG